MDTLVIAVKWSPGSKEMRESPSGPRGSKRNARVFTWSSWKQRNVRVFNRVEQQKRPRELVMDILGKVADWRQAGRRCWWVAMFCERIA